jgi:ADP-ribose pyrophosphatase YjhB (NUDIX family)
MSESGNPPDVPRVEVYALIGQQEDNLLLVEYPDYARLPGGAVHSGESIEQALRRLVLDQLGVTISDMDFCVVVEHNAAQPGDPPAFGVAFLFDVTFTASDRLDGSMPQPWRWAGDQELCTLRPVAVRDELIAGTLSMEQPWRAWRP